MTRLKRWLRKALGSRSLKPALAGLTLATSSLVASIAQASGGGNPEINWFAWKTEAPPVGWFIIYFAIFLALMIYFLRKPMREAFQKRHDKVKQAIADADEAHDGASDRYEEYKGKLANVEEEAAQFVAVGREDGAGERDKILEAGRTYADRLRTDSEAIIDQELDNANIRLRREMVEAVVDKAEQIIKAELTDEDRQRLVETAITQLEDGAEVGPKSRKHSPEKRPRAGGAA